MMGRERLAWLGLAGDAPRLVLVRSSSYQPSGFLDILWSCDEEIEDHRLLSAGGRSSRACATSSAVHDPSLSDKL